MRWEPITDLPEDRGQLESEELRSLDALWREKRSELENLDEMRAFREKLVRSWAIETGVIERVYDIDRGTTELLIEHGLKSSLIDRASTDKDPELVVKIIGDQREAIEGLFDFVKSDRELSVGYVKELHATLTRSQSHVEALDQFGNLVEVPLLHGAWKELPNNPTRPDGTVYEYCPPEHVASEMERLVGMHLEHEGEGVPPEVEAAWLHHRFTQIHPFQDGNGRVARALATLIFLRAGWFPLTIDRDRKESYIESLEAADLGNLRYLTRLFGLLERDAIARALEMGVETVRERGIEQIVRAAREDLVVRETPEESEELQRVVATVQALERVGMEELDEIKQLLDREISNHRPEFGVQVEQAEDGDDRVQWYLSGVYEISNKLFHNFVNFRTYGSWVRIRIWDREAAVWDDVVVVFHGLGREFRGLIGALAFYEQHKLGVEEGRRTRTVTRREPIVEDLFQVTYLEDPEVATRRFREWLKEAVTVGLAEWRAGLPVKRGDKEP